MARDASDSKELDRIARLEREPAPGPPLAARVRLGLLVTTGLTVLTIIEYFIAVGVENPLLWLLPFVVAKFLLILEYFMHFSALFGKGDH